MSTKQEIAERKAKQNDTYRTNPVIDAKLTKYIEDNPKLHAHYNEMPKEQLIRKLMLEKMQRQEYAQDRDKEIIEWINKNPDIKAKVESRIKNVPAETRQRAFIRAAKDEAARYTMQRGQPPPSQGIGV